MFEVWQAGGLGHLLQYMREDNAKSPKHGRKRFNSIVKTIGFDHLVIIYLWYTTRTRGVCLTVTNNVSASVRGRTNFFQRLYTLTIKARVRTRTEQFSPGSAPLAWLSSLTVLVLSSSVLCLSLKSGGRLFFRPKNKTLSPQDTLGNLSQQGRIPWEIYLSRVG